MRRRFAALTRAAAPATGLYRSAAKSAAHVDTVGRHARENSRGNARGRAFNSVAEITRVFRRIRGEMSGRNSPVCVLLAGLIAHQAAPRRERPLNGAGTPSAPTTGVVHVWVPGPH